jgi:hypothetical protein
MSEWKRFDDDDLVIPPVLARALEGVDPDTERWVIDFFRACGPNTTRCSPDTMRGAIRLKCSNTK